MLIKFAIKSGIAASAIYWTHQSNVWSDSRATEKLYNDIKIGIKPYVSKATDKIPIEMPLLPSSGELCFLGHHYYNTGVKNTINFVHMLPCYMGRWAKKGKDAITNALEAPPPIESKPAIIEKSTTDAVKSTKA